jgi:hypothetical protein
VAEYGILRGEVLQNVCYTLETPIGRAIVAIQSVEEEVECFGDVGCIWVDA